MPEKLAHSIKELSEQTWFSRSTIYEEIRREKLKAKKLGRRTVILDEDLRASLAASRLIFASLLGWLMFGEVPDVWTRVGAAIIVAATAYIARREVKSARRARRRPGHTLTRAPRRFRPARRGKRRRAPRGCS